MWARNEENRELRRFHNEEVRSLYHSPNINSTEKIFDVQMGRAWMSAFRILRGKPIRKRPRHNWEGNIRMDFKEIGVSARSWINSAHVTDYGESSCIRHWTSGFFKAWSQLDWRTTTGVSCGWLEASGETCIVSGFIILRSDKHTSWQITDNMCIGNVYKMFIMWWRNLPNIQHLYNTQSD